MFLSDLNSFQGSPGNIKQGITSPSLPFYSASSQSFNVNQLKTQLSSMFMFHSITQNTGEDSKMRSVILMVLSMVALTLLEQLFVFLPFVFAFLSGVVKLIVKRYLARFQAHEDFGENDEERQTVKKMKIQSSIKIEIHLLKTDEYTGGILHYLTNLSNARRIQYMNKMFILNHKEPMVCHEEDEIFAQMVDCNTGFSKTTTTTTKTQANEGLWLEEGEGQKRKKENISKLGVESSSLLSAATSTIRNIIEIKETESGETSGVATGGKTSASDPFQTIMFYSYRLNIDELHKFINRIVDDYKILMQNKLGNKTYFFTTLPLMVYRGHNGNIDYSKVPPNCVFTFKPFYTNRKFSNVYGPQAKLIEKRVEFFKNNRRWYDKRGVPYTLGLLLSGPPGGGKTSTIKCMANELQRHIISVKLDNNMTKQQMENLFFNESLMVNSNGKMESFIIPIDKRLYVFEDIDCHGCNIIFDREHIEFHKKENEKNKLCFSNANANEDCSEIFNLPASPPNAILPGMKLGNRPSTVKSQMFRESDNPTLDTFETQDKLTLSCLLNLLDGILETPGRIIIMTSNYVDRLDKALIRPGRIDLICQFTNCSHAMIEDFLSAFYDRPLTKEEKEKVLKIPEMKYSPAFINKKLFENFDNIDNALESIINHEIN